MTAGTGMCRLWPGVAVIQDRAEAEMGQEDIPEQAQLYTHTFVDLSTVVQHKLKYIRSHHTKYDIHLLWTIYISIHF